MAPHKLFHFAGHIKIDFFGTKDDIIKVVHVSRRLKIDGRFPCQYVTSLSNSCGKKSVNIVNTCNTPWHTSWMFYAESTCVRNPEARPPPVATIP